MDDGCLLLDADDRIVCCNHAYRRLHAPYATPFLMAGVRFETLLRMTVASGLLWPAVKSPESVILDRLGRHRARSEEPFEVQRAAGSWGLVAESWTDDGDCLLVVRDITDRRRTEVALREFNERLEAQVAARTAELADANRELEAFAYSVAHDLRAPLRHIGGFARLLTEHLGDGVDAEAARWLAVIGASAERMDHLVDGLLSLSRVGRTSLRGRMVQVEPLVNAVWEELAPEREGRDVRLRVDGLPPVYGDPTLLRQVFANLLGNAVKFTRRCPHATVHVGAGHAGEGAGEHVLFVRDDGVGFEPDYAEKLFGVFQRLHGQDDFEGTGIGLAIVQRIVARHGGRVWADGAPERGATVYVALPAAPPPHAQLPTSELQC
ncbi:MAG: PAS-domain containing protein [Ectothiorhodospiraceae bacterium]|nr:PAS-domain containing protein [Chromatiales bacterium]MCP5155428.1 PAS-domain containing protein [Ectothiorhodospiraceae bacterium]